MREEMEKTFAILLASGCRPPQGWGPRMAAQAATVWALVLADLPTEELEAAVIAYLRSPESTWWPSPGQLLALAPSRRVDAIDDADEAWGAVLSMVGRYGRLGKPDQLHSEEKKARRLEAAIQAVGGWKAIALSTTDQHTSMRASFRSAYRSYRERQKVGGELKALITLRESGRLRLLGGGK